MNDARLIQIIDAAQAESVRRSGSWLACRPGCAECCLGPFDITPLDAARLKDGMELLALADASKAAAVAERARLHKGEADEPCPALDPASRTCDLYAWRPVTCRTFGPPAVTESGAVAVCELCFNGASEQQIVDCLVESGHGELEASPLAGLGADADACTTVAEALAGL